MKKNYTQQEILLMTGTTFSQREWCEKDSTAGNKHRAQYDQLEDACWNGLLDEMLPGIIEKSTNGKKLYLWQMRHYKSFLEMELSEHPQAIEQYFSIDPYS